MIERSPRAASDLEVSVTIDRSRHTVLVVDDNPATRYATARALRAGGFRTIEAASGTEAIERAGGEISALVLDVHLPDMTGFEVCARLRNVPETSVLPIIHLSATYVTNEYRVAGLNAGADSYLTHPADPAVLIGSVQALIRARMAEEGLRRSEAKFKAIYNQAESGIVLMDSTGVLLETNPSMLRMLGRSADAVFGRRLSEFAAPEDAAAVQEKTERTGDILWRDTFTLLDAEGELLYLEWVMSPHVEPGLRVGVATNVSERRHLEEGQRLLLEREQAARLAAEKHSQTKDDFIAVLSHELRNPLNAITMGVHVLQTHGVPPAMARSLEIITQNVKAQARIISDILDVSRISSGKLTLSREMVGVSALIANAIDGMSAALRTKSLRVITEIEPGISAWLDSTRYQQVLWNLLDNGIKFSTAGSELRVTVGSDGTTLTLRVRDFGSGIDPAFLEHVFDKFAQSGSPGNRRHGGLGMGMAIVKHLAELHGGSVTVHSEGAGHGTTVEVRVPIDAREFVAVRHADAPAPSTSGTLVDVSILVVEDNLQAQEMLVMILRDHSARVTGVEDYQTALDALASQPGAIDILVSDIGLPGKDGYDLLREIRRREAEEGAARLPAIALTAFGRVEDRDAATRAGFDLHLSKPLVPHDLIAGINRLLPSGRTPAQ